MFSASTDDELRPVRLWIELPVLVEACKGSAEHRPPRALGEQNCVHNLAMMGGEALPTARTVDPGRRVVGAWGAAFPYASAMDGERDCRTERLVLPGGAGYILPMA